MKEKKPTNIFYVNISQQLDRPLEKMDWALYKFNEEDYQEVLDALDKIQDKAAKRHHIESEQ